MPPNYANRLPTRTPESANIQSSTGARIAQHESPPVQKEVSLQITAEIYPPFLLRLQLNLQAAAANPYRRRLELEDQQCPSTGIMFLTKHVEYRLFRVVELMEAGHESAWKFGSQNHFACGAVRYAPRQGARKPDRHPVCEADGKRDGGAEHLSAARRIAAW